MKHVFLSEQERLLFSPIAPVLKKLYPAFANRDLSKLPSCLQLNKHLNSLNANQKKLSFVAQTPDMSFAETGYEQRIFQHGIIATRSENWHDFFNALVWLVYPQTKVVLNAIHHHEILNQQSSSRSRTRDLLTLFDECGVIVIADDGILELIRNHNWQTLFVEQRNCWLDGSIKVITFGHALFEKYLKPYIGMTAQALLINSKPASLDSFLAKGLSNKSLLQSKGELSPLPLLGMPGWCKNQDAEFYANKFYFR